MAPMKKMASITPMATITKAESGFYITDYADGDNDDNGFQVSMAPKATLPNVVCIWPAAAKRAAWRGSCCRLITYWPARSMLTHFRRRA